VAPPEGAALTCQADADVETDAGVDVVTTMPPEGDLVI